VAAAAVGLAALAVGNQVLAKRAERRHPPKGAFLEVDGVRLHYLEAGSGEPVVLIHGNGVTAEDWVVSGFFARLVADHRVIAIDRPGFGYSSRPRSRIWTAAAQAGVLAQALDRLGVTHATIIGHSWGTLVALRLALQRPDLVAGLGLISGYYWPTPRLDVPLMSGPAIPILGDVIRFTVSPPLGRLMAPLIFKQLFSPSKVTESFKAGFATSMALRPSQIRASAEDTALMPLEAFALAQRYRQVTCPIVLIAGDGDKIASYRRQSAKLASGLGSELHTARGAGHMVHHVALPVVAAALNALVSPSEADAEPPSPATHPPHDQRVAVSVG
jgi:pimeloyl-ACP methyl ester carboxylesterase